MMHRSQVISHIKAHYHCPAEYLWAKYPDFAVFRHPENQKWFGLIAKVAYAKLGLDKPGFVDILVVKNDPDFIGSLRQEPGILPAYHMNKEHWLTALLDGATDPELVKALIETSYHLTK